MSSTGPTLLGVWLATGRKRLNGTQVKSDTYPTLERNSGAPKDFKRLIPKPVIVVVQVNGQPARALLDSGSLTDFMSATLAEQLDVRRVELAKLLTAQLVVQGSRSKVYHGTKATLQYQGINCERYFDIMNLQSYDSILGTSFTFQHQASIRVLDSSKSQRNKADDMQRPKQDTSCSTVQPGDDNAIEYEFPCPGR